MNLTLSYHHPICLAGKKQAHYSMPAFIQFIGGTSLFYSAPLPIQPRAPMPHSRSEIKSQLLYQLS